jgi:type I restriction enzyme S subunit
MVMPQKRDRELSKPKSTHPHSITLRLSDVVERGGMRLEASAYGIQAREAVAELRATGLHLSPLYGDGGLSTEAHNAFRFKRVFVAAGHGVPFLSSSDIISMKPHIDSYLSRSQTKRLDHLIIKRHDVLISRSGTIGNVALAGSTIAGLALSEDAIRVRTDDPAVAGFIAAFLRSPHGRVQLTQATYGSVIVHIEPEHLNEVLVPLLHPVRQAEIGQRMLRAVELRDQANELLDEADRALHQRLHLPYLTALTQSESRPRMNIVRASELQLRFEGSFHSPSAEIAEECLRVSNLDIVPLGDERVAREVRAITKFRKRVYVDHGGIPLLSSKQIFQIDPIDVKRLARGAHTKDLEEIDLHEGMLLVTCSGTIGRVQIIPRYMEGWTANQHANRVLAADGCNPGYLYAWLSSDYGRQLITRQSYGSVILEMDRWMLASVPVPFVSRYERDAIGDLVLRANDLRDQAWSEEQAAIEQITTIVADRAA